MRPRENLNRNFFEHCVINPEMLLTVLQGGDQDAGGGPGPPPHPVEGLHPHRVLSEPTQPNQIEVFNLKMIFYTYVYKDKK